MPPLGTSLADPRLNSQGWLPRTLNSSCFSIQGKIGYAYLVPGLTLQGT